MRSITEGMEVGGEKELQLKHGFIMKSFKARNKLSSLNILKIF
jgi:hypothetical protein